MNIQKKRLCGLFLKHYKVFYRRVKERINMTKKRLLILNGSHSDIPLIKAGKELGFYVITTGNNKNLIGNKYADEYHPEDFSDKDTAYGANAYIDIMDIFRMTYVRRQGGDLEDNNYFYLGIENIPSLIYWLNR